MNNRTDPTMRAFLSVSLLALAACAGTYVPRTSAPPPREPQIELATRPTPDGDGQSTQQWLRDEVGRQRGEVSHRQEPGRGKETAPFAPQSSSGIDGHAVVRRVSTDEDASSAWLRESAEERRAAYESGAQWEAPTPHAQATVVDRTVYVDRYVAPVGYGYDYHGYPVYYSGYARPYRSSFPLYTVTGATIGAFSSGCRSSGRNIAVGAGIGLLFDLASRW